MTCHDISWMFMTCHQLFQRGSFSAMLLVYPSRWFLLETPLPWHVTIFYYTSFNFCYMIAILSFIRTPNVTKCSWKYFQSFFPLSNTLRITNSQSLSKLISGSHIWMHYHLMTQHWQEYLVTEIVQSCMITTWTDLPGAEGPIAPPPLWHFRALEGLQVYLGCKYVPCQRGLWVVVGRYAQLCEIALCSVPKCPNLFLSPNKDATFLGPPCLHDHHLLIFHCREMNAWIWQ